MYIKIKPLKNFFFFAFFKYTFSGAEIDMQNDLGKSALHFAAIRDQAPVISLLCSKGAKVNQPDKMGHTPLHRACDWNSKAASKELIKFGANPRTKNKVNTIDN
jgi:ankyrin repeat protein